MSDSETKSVARPLAGWLRAHQAGIVVAAAIAFAFLNALMWSMTIPEAQAPDEGMHTVVTEFYRTEHRLPDPRRDAQFRAQIIDIQAPDGARLRYPYTSYSTFPPVPYV